MRLSALMLTTLAALIPGILISSWFFGPGILLNVLIAGVTALAAEALILTLRKSPLGELRNGTALLTGVLIGASVPPLTPYFVLIIGVLFAMVFGKHVYGGTGKNVFNPAMVGFAVMILSFPGAMSLWPAPGSTGFDFSALSLKATLNTAQDYDGITAATPLDAYKFREAQTNDEFFDDNATRNGAAWMWIGLGYLIGGVFLVYRKIIPWQTPTAFVGTLSILSLLFFDSGSSASLGSPFFHVFGGATLMAACFIITDPVTCPGDPRGLWVFGMGVAIFTFTIRAFGGYPEGIAFAVLLMNATSPAIDHFFASRRSA